MKPFQFRLQTKLDLTCREEEQAREDLQITIAHRDQVEKELNLIKQQVREIEDSIKTMMSAGFNLPQFLILKDYLPVLKAMRIKKEDDLQQAELMVIEARNILIEKIKESKILKKLREKEWSRYLLEVNREEQKIIDELAINSHFRKDIIQV